MKRGIIFLSLVFLVLLVNFASAINLKIEKKSSGEILIADVNNPVVFELSVTNLGPSDNFIFYNLVGFRNFPEEPVFISQAETKNITLEILPLRQLLERGYYTITIYVKSQKDNSVIREDLTFKIIDLKDAFEVGATDISPSSTETLFFIKNRENYNFENLELKVNSPFFSFERKTSLSPRETKNISIKLDKNQFRSLTSGFYTIKTEISYLGKTTEVTGVVNFVEKGIVTTTRKDFGFFVNTNVITKSNEGNKIEHADTVIKKNIISRLFTSFSPAPDFVERKGTSVYYTWVKELKPGEKFEIVVKTNWFLPFIIILFLVLIVVLVVNYTRGDIILRKNVQFVRAKGGEFALKVNLTVHARKFVERVNIIDRIPALVKLYDKFSGEAPKKVDEKTRKIEWNFERLMPGEVRVLSYIIYSKIGVTGKFALPTATAIYEREGNIKEEESNRAFFIAEQRKIEE